MKNIKEPKYSLPKKITDKKFYCIQELIDWVLENGVDPYTRVYYLGKADGRVQDYLNL